MGGAVLASSAQRPSTEEPFNLKHHKWSLIYCSFFVLGAILYGYDGTYFTGVVAMREWLEHFGDEVDANGDPAISSSQLSLLSSIVQVGEFVGALVAGFIGGRFGRRGGLIAASICVSVGAIVQMVTTSDRNYWVGGRVVLGLGVGLISNAVPLYLSENSPAGARGIIVGSWQLMLAIGQVIGACVAQGTQAMNNTGAWRIPVGLNFAIPLIFLTCIWFVPESARWYISKGRDEEARRSIERFSKGNPHADVDQALELMKEDRMRSSEDENDNASWSSLLTNPIERRKLICAAGMLFGQQIGGVQFIFSYATVIAKNLQLANPFLITIIIDIIEVVGVLAGFLIIERVGRRPLILWCTAVECVSLIIVGGLGSGPMLSPTVPPPEYGKTAIAFICIYVFAFNVSWGPLAWAMATELCPGPNRNRIMSVATCFFWITAFAVAFTLPYLYDPGSGSAGLGLKIGYIYGGLCALTGVFVWAYIGETRGKSLETINNFFIHRVPARKWGQYNLAQDWKDPLAVDAAREYQFQRRAKGNSQPEEERLEKVGSNPVEKVGSNQA